MKAVAALKLGSPSIDAFRTAAVENDSDTDWGNDGVLEWDGVADESAPRSTSISKHTLATRQYLSASSNASSNPSAQGSKVTKDTIRHNTAIPRNTNSKAKARDYIPLSDPTIDSIFTQMILNDEPLYLRILRYEVRLFFGTNKYTHIDSLNQQPIYFNVFLEKALACNLDPRGLANRLRKFLDSQVRQ